MFSAVHVTPGECNIICSAPGFLSTSPAVCRLPSVRFDLKVVRMLEVAIGLARPFASYSNVVSNGRFFGCNDAAVQILLFTPRHSECQCM